jgi:hypothetical protein
LSCSAKIKEGVNDHIRGAMANLKLTFHLDHSSGGKHRRAGRRAYHRPKTGSARGDGASSHVNAGSNEQMFGAK